MSLSSNAGCSVSWQGFVLCEVRAVSCYMGVQEGNYYYCE